MVTAERVEINDRPFWILMLPFEKTDDETSNEPVTPRSLPFVFLNGVLAKPSPATRCG